MNSIYRNIEVTTEIPENFRDDKLPVLDFKCWVDNTKKVYTAGTGTERPIETRRILYTFFEKDMSSKFAIMKTSALPEKTKISSLSNDLMRRMKNVSEDLDQKTRNEVVDAYAKRLILSGYKQEQVREIVVAGLKGYEKVVTMAKEGKTMIHRSAASSAASRYKKKLTGKSTWFLDKAKSEKEEDKEYGQSQKQGNAKNGKIANLEDSHSPLHYADTKWAAGHQDKRSRARTSRIVRQQGQDSRKKWKDHEVPAGKNQPPGRPTM